MSGEEYVSAGRQMLHFLRDTFVRRRRLSRSRSRRQSSGDVEVMATVHPYPAAPDPDPHCPQCPLLVPAADAEAGQPVQAMELLDFESPIPPNDRDLFGGEPPPVPPRPSSVDNQCDQQCHSPHSGFTDPLGVVLLENLPPKASASPVTTPSSTFKSSSGVSRSESWEFSPTARNGGGCQLNEGFVSSDSESEDIADGDVASRSISPSSSSSSSSSTVVPERCSAVYSDRSSSATLVPEPAVNPLLARRASHRLSLIERRADVLTPERPRSANSLSFDLGRDEWHPDGKPPQIPRLPKLPKMIPKLGKTPSDLGYTLHDSPGSAAVAAPPSALSRCRQRASMFVTSARNSLSGRRPRSFCYTNTGMEDAILGPLPRDSSSFLRSASLPQAPLAGDTPQPQLQPPSPCSPLSQPATAPACLPAFQPPASSLSAFDRSSMVEPLQRWSAEWTLSPERARPHSTAAIRIRRDSETCSSCGTEEIDWSWVEEEEAQLQQQQQQHQQQQQQQQQQQVQQQQQQQVQQQQQQVQRPPPPQHQPVERLQPGPDDGEKQCRVQRQQLVGQQQQQGQEARSEGGSTESPLAGVTNWSYQVDEDQEDTAEEPLPSTSSRPRRPSSWLRASMRRVRRFRLADPDATHRRSAPPDVLPHLPACTAAVLLSPSHSASAVNTRVSDPVVTPSSSAPLTPPVNPLPRPLSAPVVGRQCGRAASRPDSRTVLRRQPSVESPPSLSASTSSSSSSSSDSSSAPTPSSRPAAAHAQHSDARSCESAGMPEGSGGPSPLGQWPHNLSSTLACLGCTVGLFNISRFAVLSVQFGANFIIQFLLLSVVFGIPLYTFQVCLGQYLGAGAVDMWRISPVFQGVGIALLVSQALIGVYSIVGVSWIFIYFRDSFITKQDRYRWAEPFDLYREDQRLFYNATPHLEQTVPDYFNGVVLQRHNLAQPENSFGHIKFQVAFNLAVVWMIVFVSLSKGLRSYGKVVYVFTVLPVFGMLVLCTKMLGLMPRDSGHQVFPETEWTEFFINSNCWVAATTEVFLTWGLLGTAAMQIASQNKQKTLLQRDSSLVIVFTVSMLLLAAFLANMCVALLLSNGFSYVPSSFERMSTYQFLQPTDRYRYQIPLTYATTPVRWMPHTSFVVGERVQQPGSNVAQDSGFQVLRLATELVPSTLALLGADQVSPFWAVLFYFVLILFGIAQQLAIWHCVITGIMAINAQNLKSWETTITFFSCACGFILGLPMTTELGIFVVYFLDYCVGSGWWIMVLYLLQIGAVLVVRGRPYSGEAIAATLFHKTRSCFLVWAAPMLTFTWNVILPVILMVVCITVFKKGGSRDLYSWHVSMGYDYWPLWAREVGSMLQLLPILTIPVVGVIQSCRYLSSGPPDIFDRLQLLYRPQLGSQNNLHDLSTQTDPPTGNTTTPASNGASTENPVIEDPPPKYTPPPSYTTATGARIAKMLRQSFRRSVRRIQLAVGGLGEQSESNSRRQSASQNADTSSALPSPPDYAAVLVEISQASSRDTAVILEPRVGGGSGIDPAGPSSLAKTEEPEPLDFLRATPVPAPTPGVTHHRALSSLTAADVASILRTSGRRSAQPARSHSLCAHPGRPACGHDNPA